MIRLSSTSFAPLALSLCILPALAQGLDSLPHPATKTQIAPAKAVAKPQAAPQKAAKPRANPFGLPSPAHRDSLGSAAADPDAVLLDNPPADEAPIQAPTPKPAPAKTPKAPRATSVGGVSIKGMTDAKAVRVLRAALAPKLRANVDVFDGQTIHPVRRDKLGATIPYLALIHRARKKGGDVPLRFQVDSGKARRTLRALASELAKPAIQTVANAQTFKTTLALEGSLLRLKAALESQPPQNRVELVVAQVALPAPTPKTGAIAADAPRGFPYLLAEFATPYDAGVRGRTNNLKMAASHVNGTIVKTGDVFSANDAIGRRDAAAGWREAKMFVGGQVVTGIGAGICQCSTTIYNAALLANLPIVERHQHMFRVSYAQASRDAAIYWGQKDLKWRNNTGGPILVRTYLRGGKFHARLYGTAPNATQVEIASHTLSRQGGTRSEAFRIVRTTDGTTKQRLSRDFYRPHP